MNENKIAILMATYNVEKYVSEQIDSILKQSNRNWTLYIRDDCSSDNTVKIVQKYTSLYDNIILLSDTKGNLGCKCNFFELLQNVNSEYYMFSDADDVWLPNKIQLSFEKMIELEELHCNCPILIHTDLTITDSNLNIIYNSMWRAGKINPDKIKSYNYLAIHGYVGGATMLFNQRAKEVSLPINQNVYMHDLWIGLCVIRNGIVYSLHESTMLYRQHEHNAVGGVSEENLKLMYKFKNIKSVVRKNWETYRMLSKIGYGSFFKYLYYKLSLLILMRSGKMF